CWIRGTVWGAGWVSWRSGHGYVGWAPLAPGGVRVHDYRRPGWHFTGAGELGSPRMRFFDQRRNATVFASTRVIRNDRAMPLASGTSVRYNAGPVVHVPSQRLADVAPRALPRFNVEPRLGAAPGPAGRTWDQRGQPQYRVPSQPQYRAPQQQPVYRAPQQQPQPQFRGPQPQQQPQPQPQFRGPQPQQQPQEQPRFHDQRMQPRTFYRPNVAPRPQYATPRFNEARMQAPPMRMQAPPMRMQAPTYHSQTFSRPSYSAPRVHDGRRH